MLEPLQHFVDEGLVSSVVRPLKSGKEASVVLCRTVVETTGVALAALKVYHPLDRRNFRNEATYREGEWIPDRRMQRALGKGSRFGREVQLPLWVEREWLTLQLLYQGGLPVPRPISRHGDAILMDHIGDEGASAPQLRSHRPAGAGEAARLLDRTLEVVRGMLRLDVVHADLSPYNVLVWDGAITVIDMPQAVDPRRNRGAADMLRRDLTRLCAWGSQLGVDRDVDAIVDEMWTAWELADLVPEELRGL